MATDIEQMIEAIVEEKGGVAIIKQAEGFYIAGIPETGEFGNADMGDTPREALEKLTAAWRERE